MAGIMEKKNQQTQTVTVQPKSATVATPAAANQQTTTQQPTTSGTTTTVTGGQYAGYKPSAGVQAAQDYLNGVMNNKPIADANLSALYDKIMNRENFTYDLNGDALYQQYKDRYQTMGQQAMMDTMGNAAALTGGYGSSYATTAGNQAYQQYLQGLNDIVPELYQQAYNRYAQEGNDLMNQYNMAYGQYRDQVGDWENERAYANSDYWQQYNADYNEYMADRDYAYTLAMAMIKRGKMPSDDMLAAAGLTQDDAKKLGAKTSSSKKKTVSNSNDDDKKEDEEEKTEPEPIPEWRKNWYGDWSHFYSKK